MPDRRAEAEWEGNLKDGRGRLKLESGAFQGNYSFRTGSRTAREPIPKNFWEPHTRAASRWL